MSKVRNDIILAVVLLLVAVTGFLLYKNFQKDGDYAVVMVDKTEYARLPLNKDSELIISGVGGTNTLVIKDGKADIIHADCPDGICVDHAPIFKVGETIVCLPHSVVVGGEVDPCTWMSFVNVCAACECH